MKKQTKKKIINKAKEVGNTIIKNIKNTPEPGWGLNSKKDDELVKDLLKVLEGVSVSRAIQVLKDCITLVEDNSVVGRIKDDKSIWA